MNNPGTTDRVLSANTELLLVLGALLSSWLAERLGRKKAILIGCVTACIGGALQAGSVNLAMFIIFRFVNGFGVGKC